MSVGILQQEESTLVEVNEKGSSFTIVNNNSIENNSYKKSAVIGLPIKDLIIKNIYIPGVAKKDLQKTIDLQIEFNIPNYKQEYNTSYLTKKYKSGFVILITASRKISYDKCIKAVIPVPLALYAFAYYKNILPKSGNTLLISFTQDTVNCVTLIGSEVVFMRSFDNSENLKRAISLSSQSVYLQLERQFIEVDKILVFSQTKEQCKLVTESVDEKKEILWVDTSDCLSKNGDDLFLPVGLALFDKIRNKMLGWSLSKKPPGRKETLNRILYWLIPIIIIFIPVYYYAEYYSKQSKIKEIQASLNQLSSQIGSVGNLGSKVTQADNYMLEIGDPSLNAARINKLVNILNNCRPKDLWFTNITGKIDEELVGSGFTPSYNNVRILIKNLQNTNFFEELNLNYSNEASGEVVAFQLNFKLKPKYKSLFNKNDDTTKVGESVSR